MRHCSCAALDLVGSPLALLRVFAGHNLTALSQPLPFFAYPAFVLTLFGWAWWCRGLAARKN